MKRLNIKTPMKHLKIPIGKRLDTFEDLKYISGRYIQAWIRWLKSKGKCNFETQSGGVL